MLSLGRVLKDSLKDRPMSSFRFKQFAVEQSGVAMKVGTDGVLLGAWASFGDARRVLDIGTGTGVIALMAAQRSSAATIVAVEIDRAAAACASSNFVASPWSDRLSVVEGAVQEYAAEEQFDYIISNPPYFVDSLRSPDARRTMARHTTDLTFEQLAAAVERLLATSGRFGIVLPTEQMEQFASTTSLVMLRRCNVHSVPGGAVKRVLAEFGHERSGELVVETLTIETDVRGQFSDQYRALTQDFYLKF